MALQSLLIFISCLLCFFAFPKANLYWLQCISLIPLLFVFKHYFFKTFTLPYSKKLLSFSIVGFLYGLGYMGLTNLWVFELIEFSTPFTIAILFIIYTIIEALFFGLIGLCYRLLNAKPIFLPFIWIVFEWLRSIGSFGSPNGILGYSQASNKLINHVASIGGIFFVSFICVLINILLFYVITAMIQRNHKKFILNICLIILILISSFLYKFPLEANSRTLQIATIQANHSMQYKFDRKMRPRIRQDYINLSKATFDHFSPHLILWPETITSSQNLLFSSLMNPINDMVHDYDVAFILGSPRKQSSNYYNSAAFISKNSLLTYDKIKLMPFGEYWPFKRIFQWFRLSNIIPGSEFTHGVSTQLFLLDNLKIAPIICLESTTSLLTRRYANQGADIIVSLVNNAWFKASSIAARQLQMLQFRSIEVGLPSVQSANMGFSAFINANGEIIGLIKKYDQTYLVKTINVNYKNTLFRSLGNKIVLLSLLVLIIAFILQRILKQSY